MWYSPGIEALNGKYLPSLKILWLNLTTFEDSISPRVGSIYNIQPPAVFLEGLDSLELSLLNIKFPLYTAGKMLLDVVSAANSSFRLRNLTELALAGGGWFSTGNECGSRPESRIPPTDLRAALTMLLPMPRLKTLRLSVSPNFLDILDLDLYKSIADGLPALEKLYLGHKEFLSSSIFQPMMFYERVPLQHLAAFCHMFPNLTEVSLGTADGMTLEEQPHSEWECLGISKLTISHWARSWPGRGESEELLHLSLRTYFPNSDLAAKGLNPSLYIFE